MSVCFFVIQFLGCLFLTFPSGYLEAELVHGVDLVEIVHDKVEQRSSDSNGTIVFSGFVYLHLINFSFQDLRVRDGGRRQKKKRWNK